MTKEKYKEVLETQYNDVIVNDFITLGDFKELSIYADKLTRYLKECLE